MAVSIVPLGITGALQTVSYSALLFELRGAGSLFSTDFLLEATNSSFACSIEPIQISHSTLNRIQSISS